MSSRAKRKARNRGQRPPIEAAKKPDNTLRSWLGFLSPTGKFAAAFALLLTIVGTYYTFSPKFTIEPKDSLDSTNPFATPFTIKNDSLFDVSTISIKGGIRKVYTKNGSSFSDFGVMTSAPPIPNLEPGEATTFIIPFPFNSPFPFSFADIAIMVSYRPALLPFTRNKSLRFATIEAKDGTLHWVSKAISE